MDRVRRRYQGPLAWAIDNMVLNLRPGQRNPAPPKYDGPYAQSSDYTMRHILPKYKR